MCIRDRNKRWEETSYPVNQLQETVISDFKQWNETLDSTSESIKETLNENMEPENQKMTQKAVSYTHLDVYKRQVITCQLVI